MKPGKRPVNTGFVIDLSLAISDVQMACPSVNEYLEPVGAWEVHVCTEGVLSRLLGEQQGPTIGGPLPQEEEEEDDWLNADPAAREEELIRVINSFGTTPPPKELLECLERTQMERQMIELDTLEMQADLEMRAREQLEMHRLEQEEFEQMELEMQAMNMSQMEREMAARAEMELEMGMQQMGMPPQVHMMQPMNHMQMHDMQQQMMFIGAPPPGMGQPMRNENGDVFYM